MGWTEEVYQSLFSAVTGSLLTESGWQLICGLCKSVFLAAYPMGSMQCADNYLRATTPNTFVDRFRSMSIVAAWGRGNATPTETTSTLQPNPLAILFSNNPVNLLTAAVYTRNPICLHSLVNLTALHALLPFLWLEFAMHINAHMASQGQ